MNGFLLVDKPKGMTSQTAINIIKKKFDLKKCGHSGTLDPNTTGLLLVAFNQATKLMKYLNEHDKVYQTTISFGYNSNTLDITGTILEDIDMNFTVDQLDSALKQLALKTSQLPPLVSAIKVNGKKLYEYERSNKEVEVKERPIKIYEIKRLSELRTVNNHLEVDLLISCSKGFYVRSFARDLGLALNGVAVMKELRRTKSGDFDIKDAIPLDKLTLDNMLSIDDVFHFDSLEVNDYLAHLALNGVVFDERQIKTLNPFYVVNNDCKVALYENIGNYQYKPLIIFKK